jgi:hypothetical protein
MPPFTYDILCVSGQHQQASQLAEEILTETFEWEASMPTFTECVDEEVACVDWAKKGECTGNPGFMLNNCRMSCGSCTYRERGDHRPATAQHRECALLSRCRRWLGLGTRISDSHLTCSIASWQRCGRGPARRGAGFSVISRYRGE